MAASKKSKATEAAPRNNPASPDAQYFEKQAATGHAFRSPFAMLNLTLADCMAQRGELAISAADFESSKATFNNMITEVVEKNGYPDSLEKVDWMLHLGYEFVANGMRDDRYPREFWPLVACHAALMTLHALQQKKGFTVDAAMTNIALFAQGMMNIAWKPARLNAAMEGWAKQNTLSNEIQQTNRLLVDLNNELKARASAYERFRSQQTRKDKRGEIAKAIKVYLMRYPKAKPRDVFDALAAQRSLRQYVFHSPKWMGYDPEVRKSDDVTIVMKWARFQNLVSELRPR